MAARYGVYLVGGSIPCTAANEYSNAPALSAEQARVYAACFVYDSIGQEIARYDKVHLFDAMLTMPKANTENPIPLHRVKAAVF